MAQLCKCGCGLEAPIAYKTATRRGQIKGQPCDYLPNHNRRYLEYRQLKLRLLNKRRLVPCKVDIKISTNSPYPEAKDCWEWTGQIDKFGYGRMSFNSRKQFVHRLAYQEFVGPIPEGLEPDHLCRNHACFNPWHLEPVTGAENHRRGKNAKLTHTDVAIIRALDEPHTVTAEFFGVDSSTICDIRNFRIWNYDGGLR